MFFDSVIAMLIILCCDFHFSLHQQNLLYFSLSGALNLKRVHFENQTISPLSHQVVAQHMKPNPTTGAVYQLFSLNLVGSSLTSLNTSQPTTQMKQLLACSPSLFPYPPFLSPLASSLGLGLRYNLPFIPFRQT